MSILADLQGIVGAALGDVFPAAILYQTSQGESDGQGGYTAGRSDARNCKAFIDTYSDARVAAGIPVNDRQVMILGASLAANVTPQPGNTIRVGAPGKPVTRSDRLWTIIAVERDPAAATWVCQAR